MTFPQGVNFRATAGYVTDPTNYTYEIGTNPDYPTVSPQGNNIGWTVTTGNARDRNSGNDPRLAGMAFDMGAVYEIDLPSAGSYIIHVAVGDDVYACSNQYVEIFDDTTSLGTLFTAGSTGAANSFLDATGTVYTAANWPTSETGVTKTFSTTKCKIHIGDGSNFTMLASVFVESAGGGPSPVHGTLSETLGTLTSSATGTVTVKGTASDTLGSLTSSATGAVTVKGTLSKTLGSLTLAATGFGTGVHATLSETLGALTLSATGTVTGHLTLSETLGTLTAVSTATVTSHATLAKTLGVLAGTETDKAIVKTVLSKTLGSLTGTITGHVPFGTTSYSLSKTLGGLTTYYTTAKTLDQSVNVKKYITVAPYKPNTPPGQQDTIFGRYILNELQKLSRSLQSQTEAAIQTSAVAPINPLVGTMRYATGDWAKALGAEGLYIYKSTGWTHIV